MQFVKLKKFNLIASFLHFVQGSVVLLISNDTSREVIAEFLTFNESTMSLEPASEALFSLEIGLLVAIFFYLSAFAHLYVSTIGHESYVKNLKKGINKARWYEYSLSASLMIVLIGMLAGIFNFGALLGMFVLTAIMNLLGLVMEVHNQTTKKTNWLSYNIGVLAGIVPWILIATTLLVTENSSGGDVPTFVYWIFFSIFVFFSSFAVNMILQYRQTGKWQDYLYGEKVYIILSLTAKSALAWQIYAGTLQPV